MFKKNLNSILLWQFQDCWSNKHVFLAWSSITKQIYKENQWYESNKHETIVAQQGEFPRWGMCGVRTHIVLHSYIPRCFFYYILTVSSQLCTGGWTLFNGRCYKVFHDEKDWFESRRACNTSGGDLVVIKSTDLQVWESVTGDDPCRTDPGFWFSGALNSFIVG